MARINYNNSLYTKRIIEVYREMQPDVNVEGVALDLNSLITNKEQALEILSNLYIMSSNKSVFFDIGKKLFYQDEQIVYMDRNVGLMDNVLLCLQHYSLSLPRSQNEVSIIQNRVILSHRRNRELNHNLGPVIATMLGYLVAMFKSRLGALFAEEKLTVCAHYVDMFPNSSRFNMIAAPENQRDELTINFPSSWLIAPISNMGVSEVPSQFELVKRHCEDHIDCIDWSIDELALKVGMSKRTLQRLLAKEEITFRKLMSDVKIDKAKELLTNSTLSATEISEICGFSELASFSRSFKLSTGFSPKLYRVRNYKVSNSFR